MTTKQLPSDITTLNSNNVNYNSINFIYKRTSTGAIQVWAQEVVLHQYRSVIGQIDGKLQVSDWTTAKPKNIGKSNQRSGTQQALYEVAANYTKKLKEGYFEFIEDIDNETYTKPMLANNYDDYKHKIAKEEPQLVYLSSKLDGERCTVNTKGLFSRTGEVIASCDHIQEALKPLFDIYPDLVLDGELYSKDISFNDIGSIVSRDYNLNKELNTKYSRKQPSDKKLVGKLDSRLVDYYIYDLVLDNKVFADRLSLMLLLERKGLLNNINLKLVDHFSCSSHNIDLIDRHYKTCLSKGYEGQMIRFNTVYIHKRTKYLLKRKEWIDSEYILLDIVGGEGNWSGKARIAVFDGFNADIVGSYDNCSYWLANKDLYIGKPTTVKYFELTEAGVPRFGKVKQLARKFI